MTTSKVGLAILGAGNVGGSLIALIDDQHQYIERRCNLTVEVRAVGVRDVAKTRTGIDVSLLSDNLEEIVLRDDVDVVVELIGSISPARQLIETALRAGKSVVSANKELVAQCGPELVELAMQNNVRFIYEAAVGGGIPILRALRESLYGETINSIVGIVNGTTNFILTRMSEDGSSFDEALQEAQKLGFAEANPSADVDSFDAASKARVLAQLAFDTFVDERDVLREGITHVSAQDIDAARRLGYVIKAVACVARNEDGEVGVGTYPAMVPEHHPLASVRNAFNALFVNGQAVGDLMFYGQGAGGLPTASAVLGDILDVAQIPPQESPNNSRQPTASAKEKTRVWSVGAQQSAFHVTMDVSDRPGVLANVASVFGQHNVSIQSMEQVGLGNQARLLFITHVAKEADMEACLKTFANTECVTRVKTVMRVLS